MLKKLVACTLGALALSGSAGCTMSQAQKDAYEKERVQRTAEIAARQGPPVNRVCPRRSDGWKPFGNGAFLLEADGQWYRVELTGTCDPEGAFAGIATRGGPSSCLHRGDAILTSRPRDRERCTITAIYSWNAADPTPETKPKE